MEIYNVNGEEFRRYGKVWNIPCEKLKRDMKHAPLPDDVIYTPSDEVLEADVDEVELIRNQVYGGMPIQVGYCNGHNQKLNAVEYHRDSEVNIAVTDMILLLGLLPDVTDDFVYDTSKVEAFFVPKGTVVEMYSTTLHYAPCGVDGAGFKAIVVLPKGTNTEIDFPLAKSGENVLMTAKNKWLIAHPDAKIEGAFEGLVGENVEV